MRVTDTNLDDGDLDVFTPEEADTIKRWYAETHGEGNLDLARHVPFLIEHDPGTFKRQRQYMQAVRDDEHGLPLFAIGLIFVYGYVVLRDERGIFYEIIASREWGARKSEVLATIRAAYPQAGPLAINLVAERAEAYLDAWQDDEAAPRAEAWPDGWAPGPPSAPAQRPHWVDFLARHRPEALPPLRERLAHATASELPRQLFPLFELFAAALTGRPDVARDAVAAARRAGVRRDHVVETVCWAFLYADEHRMSALTQAIERELEAWDG